MAKKILLKIFSLFFLLSLIASGIPPAKSSALPENSFIKTSCRITTYPDLCVSSLSAYAETVQQSPQRLAGAALEVSLNRLISAQTFMKKLMKFKGLTARHYAAIRDCLEEVEDSLDRVSKSCKEMKGMGRVTGEEFTWHMSNVETWVSAALTDETTCMDGFSGRVMEGKVKESVRAQITSVAHVTSNALALVNDFAAKHKQ